MEDPEMTEGNEMEDPEEEFDPFKDIPLRVELKKYLEPLKIQKRIALAAYSCQRLYPFYVEHCSDYEVGDPALFQHIVNSLWHFAQGEPVSISTLNQQAQKLRELDLGEEGIWKTWYSADSAVAAVSHAVLACEGSVEQAILAEEQLIERVCRLLELDESFNEEETDEHPLVQAELQNLLCVLDLIKNLNTLSSKDVAQLRKMAIEKS